MTTPIGRSNGLSNELRRRPVPPPGESALLGAALAIGILLMGLQLWILTVALEEFQRNNPRQIDALAGMSAVVFAGGLGMLWLLRRNPSVRRTSIP